MDYPEKTRLVNRQWSLRKKIFLLAIAFLLVELLAKVLLFANIRGVLENDQLSEARRIAWVRGVTLKWLKGLDRGNGIQSPTRLSMDTYDPRLGWKPRAAWQERKSKISLSINSKGMRGLREFTEEKKGPRIAVMGDSFTFGEGVSDEETYPYLIGELLEIEVLNFGVHGYGHDQILIRLHEEALGYQPDIVLLGFIANDMGRNMLSFRDFAKPRFRIGGGGELILENQPVPPPWRFLLIEPFRIHILDLLKILSSRVDKENPEVTEAVKQVTHALIREMRDACASKGALFTMAYLPWGDFVSTDLRSLREEFFEYVADIENIPSVNLRPSFRRSYRQGVKFKMSHWGPEGHSLAAKDLIEFLGPLLERTRTAGKKERDEM